MTNFSLPPLKLRNALSSLWITAVILCLLLVCARPLLATQRTPDDVYAKTLLIRSQVEQIRSLYDIESPWPKVPVQINKKPSHVLQKCFEVMEKINRLRRIEDLGEITIPAYPARRITPLEVYELVQRLEQELWLILEYKHNIAPYSLSHEKIIGKSPNDVYQKLWEISYALNPLLGMRGVSPNDAYALTEQILSEIRFLRNSQNIISTKDKPPLATGHHPNHALQAVSELMTTIAKAQKNLWLAPVVPNKVPRRVITISDVYDGLLGIRAELQRIKFRLGLERTFPLKRPEKRHDSDDIIRNLKWARELMPLFPLNKTLSQYDRESLVKKPDHVYQVADHILWELHNYKERLGIRQTIEKKFPIEGLAPQHVYDKTLECIRQVSLLRSSKELGPIAVPFAPLRTITPDEVFELVTRLDMELEVLYRSGGVESVPWYNDHRSRIQGKTSSDVYNKTREIADEIDILLGSPSYSPGDTYVLADKIRQELLIISDHLGVNIIEKVDVQSDLALQPRHVLATSHEVWDLVKLVQRRAGIKSPIFPLSSPNSRTTTTVVYNELQLILTEIRGLKLHFDVTVFPSSLPGFPRKNSSDVEQNLRQSIFLLQQLIGLAETGEVQE